MSRFITIEKLNKFYMDLKEKIKNNYYSKLEFDDLMSPIEQTVGELELRTHIGKQLDYGSFKITGNLIQEQYVTIEKVGEGNIDISSTNNGFMLSPYKTYSLRSEIGLQDSNSIFNIFKNKTNDIDIGIRGNIEASAKYESSNAVAIITPTEEIEVGLYITKLTSSTFRSGYIIIEEIGRQVIIDPAEEAKNIEFDRGYFTVKYATGTVFTQNQHIKFDNKINGNLELDSNGGIILKANKEYVIDYGIQGHTITTGNVTFALYDLNTNQEIQNTRFYPFTSDAGYNYTSSTSRSLRLVPENDISLVAIQLQNKSFSIVTDGCFMNIREDAHPYYFNYFKDSIGSKILFEGTANLKGEYSLNDDVANYEWLIVEWDSKIVNGELYQEYTDIIRVNNISSTSRHIVSNSFFYDNRNYSQSIFINFPDNNKFKLLDNVYGSQYYVVGHGIKRIIGYGFNYENPYKNLISGTSSFSYTEEDINEIYNELGGN